MQDYLIWTIVGFVLIIVEMVTGTFYCWCWASALFAGALPPGWVHPSWCKWRWPGWSRSLAPGWSSNGTPNSTSRTIRATRWTWAKPTLVRWVNQADGSMEVKYRGSGGMRV